MFTDEVYITKVPLKLFGGEVYDKSEKYLQKDLQSCRFLVKRGSKVW